MKSSQLLLLSFAFLGICIAAKQAQVGAPAARMVDASQLAENGSKPGRVNVTGQIVNIDRRVRTMNVTIREGTGRQILVVITPEAGHNSIRLGHYYSFEGEVLSGNTIVVSLPRSIRKMYGDISFQTRRVCVNREIAYWGHSCGTTRIPAPGIPNGVWDVTIVNVEGGSTIATLPGSH